MVLKQVFVTIKTGISVILYSVLHQQRTSYAEPHKTHKNEQKDKKVHVRESSTSDSG